MCCVGAYVCGACVLCGVVCVRRVWCGVFCACVGACGVCAGHGGEKVSLAALLSGYLGKSGHLPRWHKKEFHFV